MGSEFLKNLKTAVDGGEFNSEAAKKIIEIDNLAEEKKGSTPALNYIADKIDDGTIKLKKVTEEEAEMINSEYEKQMEAIKQTDLANAQLANLIEIEDMVKATIGDMITFANDLKEQFGKEFEAKNPAFENLLGKINEINMKYNNSIINN
jgi:hypothetical protein